MAKTLDGQQQRAETVTRAATIQTLLADGYERVLGAIKAGKATPDGQVPAFPAVMQEMASLRDSALDSLPDAAARAALEPKLDDLTRRFGPQVLQATTAQRLDGQRRVADATLAAFARRAADSGDPLDRWQQLQDGFSLVDALGEAGVYDTAAAETKKLAFRSTLARGSLRADIDADPARVLAGLDAGAYDGLLPEENREAWRGAARTAQAARDTQAAQDARLRQAREATDLARGVETGAAGLPEVEAADLAPVDRDRLRAQARRTETSRAAAARGIDQVEDALVRGAALNLADPAIARALDAHFQAVAQPWVARPNADSPARLAAYTGRLGAVPNGLAGAVLDSLQAGGAPQALLAAETLDRVTAAVPGSLAQFPDTAATRAHLIVALTEAGLAPADAVARAAEQMGVDSTARETRRAEGEAAAGAPRTRAFLTRAWADAADDADALPQPAEDRFATLFTDAFTASGDERVARSLAFKRLLGEIGEGKGRDWVGEENERVVSDSKDDEAEKLLGGIGDDALTEFAGSLLQIAGTTESAGRRPKIDPRVVAEQLRQLFRGRGRQNLPEPKKPDDPNVPQAPRSGEAQPVPKSEESTPKLPQDAPSGPQQRPLRPTGIAEIARQEVERERDKEKKEESQSRFSDREEELLGLLNGKSYVRNRDGSYVLGRINEEQAAAMGKLAGELHLPEGFNTEDGQGYGYRHFLREIRKKSILDHGYPSVADFINDVGMNFTEIRRGKKGRFLLIKRNGKAETLAVELEKNGTGFDVISGGVFRRRYAERNAELLWKKDTHPN